MIRRPFRLVPHVRFGPLPRLRPPVTFAGRVTRRRLLPARSMRLLRPLLTPRPVARPSLDAPQCLDGRLKPAPHEDEASPGKSALFRCTTPWFTSGAEPRASLCCASSPVPSALYHVGPVPQAARSCRFARNLFISSRIVILRFACRCVVAPLLGTPSLPPAGRLPFPPCLQVIVS